MMVIKEIEMKTFRQYLAESAKSSKEIEKELDSVKSTLNSMLKSGKSVHPDVVKGLTDKIADLEKQLKNAKA